MVSPGPRRLLLFVGDGSFLQLLMALDTELNCGSVVVKIRPQLHAVLRELGETHRLLLIIQPRPSSVPYSAFVKQVREEAPDLIVVDS